MPLRDRCHFKVDKARIIFFKAILHWRTNSHNLSNEYHRSLLSGRFIERRKRGAGARPAGRGNYKEQYDSAAHEHISGSHDLTKTNGGVA
jgi:hypothetical protein